MLVSKTRGFYAYTRDYWIVYNFLLIEPIINLTFSLACNLSFKDYSMRMEIFSKLSSILSNCYLRTIGVFVHVSLDFLARFVKVLLVFWKRVLSGC